MSGSPETLEFSPAWIEERWRAYRRPKKLADAGLVAGRNPVHDRLFAWLRAREQTPALVEVDMPALFSEHASRHGRTRSPGQDVESQAQINRSTVLRLRALLPEDCFPLEWSLISARFVTGQARAVSELEDLGERLLGELRRVPVRVNRRDLVRVEGVRMCLADDGSGYNRVSNLLTFGVPGSEAGAPLSVTRARHHGVHNPELGSAARLLERDLPRLRGERPGSKIGLLGLTPAGYRWRSLPKGPYGRPNRDGTGDVWSQISQLALRWGAERGVNPCELTLGNEAALGFPLALPARHAENGLDGLAEYLSQQTYHNGGYEWGYRVVAQPGELEFRTACVPVPPGSDGSAEIGELRRRLAPLPNEPATGKSA